MFRTGSAIFFENAEDFQSHCEQDTHGRGYVYNKMPITYPSGFPAAFKYESDFDPRCCGSYAQMDFIIAMEAAILGLESAIKKCEEDKACLEKLARAAFANVANTD